MEQRTSAEILAAQASVGCTRIDLDTANEGAIKEILDHFDCESLEDAVSKLDEYTHDDDLYEYAINCYDLVSTDRISEMASDMDTQFSDFMNDNEDVRQKLGYFILTDENLDQLRKMFHNVLSENGLE